MQNRLTFAQIISIMKEKNGGKTMNKSKKNFSSKSFKLNKLKTILLFVILALTLAGGGAFSC